MHKRIYKQIAKKHGVSVTEVKQEMQAAIDSVYENPNIYALSVSRKKSVPTVDEFIEFVVKELNQNS